MAELGVEGIVWIDGSIRALDSAEGRGPPAMEERGRGGRTSTEGLADVDVVVGIELCDMECRNGGGAPSLLCLDRCCCCCCCFGVDFLPKKLARAQPVGDFLLA